MGKIVEGNTKCPECRTDKSWSLVVDQGNLTDGEMTKQIRKSIERQNEQVVDVNHKGHTDKLIKKVRII